MRFALARVIMGAVAWTQAPRHVARACPPGVRSTGGNAIYILSQTRIQRTAPHRFIHHTRGAIITAAAAQAAEVAQEEKYAYQAEVDRLLDMIVNSLYSNREVFLRELVSNCSDALDKARFVSLTRPEILEGNEKLEIRIKADNENHTITVEDTGIGMTRDDLLSQLGTIARSGTRKFMESVKEAKGDTNLIGQFGVGFYSSFLVSDKVKVQTKNPDDEKQWVWESTAGSHEFTISEDTSPSLGRGTRVTLFLKEDCHELSDAFKLKSLLKQYSEFISFPIYAYVSKREPKQIKDEAATEKKQEEENENAKKEDRDPKKVDDVTKTEYEDVWEWEVQNDNKPIWTRNPKEVEKEQYDSFYKQTFSEFLEPLAHSHFSVEGTIEFSSILFVPGMAPFEQDFSKKSNSIRLFVKRVFISDEFDDDLMPRYLSFVKGVVDSSDLPLNVSREILQENKIVRVIRKQLVRRSLDMFEEISKRETTNDYKTFWEAFGRNLKLGIIEDNANRDRLASLLRFYSSNNDDELTGLDDYVGRMKEGQKGIYYMAADSIKTAKAAPFVEKLAKRGLEILYLTEPIDEVAVSNIGKYKDFAIEDVSKENLELAGEEEDSPKEETEAKYKKLTEFIKETLGDQVEKVAVSSRLTDSPCIVVTSKHGWSANMERIMKNQTMADSRAMEYMKGRKIMEINPDHELIKSLNAEIGRSGGDDRAAELTNVLFETALLTSGFSVDSPSDYAAKVYRMLSGAMGNSTDSTASAVDSGPTEKEVETVTPEVVTEEDPWKK